jgi:hypothetical protein
MAPLSQELREKIEQLAATLTDVSIAYRYTKARTMLDPEFAERQRESKRASFKKRYTEDEEFRAKHILKNADYTPSSTKSYEKQRERYHTDEAYRQGKLAQKRAYYARKKLERMQQGEGNDTISEQTRVTLEDH